MSRHIDAKPAIALALLILACASRSASAAPRPEPPYNAVVTERTLSVRSGPGKQFYPTRKLKRGDKVRVLRHDWGGWYMIEPPADAFCWIRAEYVRVPPANPKAGIVTEDNVVVWTGSLFGDDHNVKQVTLTKTSRVEILGEKTFDRGRDRVKMYKIAPPRGEYRWVDGSDIVPESEANFPLQQGDPFDDGQFDPVAVDHTPAHEPIADPVANQEDTPLQQRAVVRIGSDGKPRRATPPQSGGFIALRNELTQLDAAYAAMMEEDRRRWDFAPFREEYEELLGRVQTAGNAGLVGQLEWRLRSLNRYAALHKEYMEFVNLTDRTKQREREFLAIAASAADEAETNTDVASSRSPSPVRPDRLRPYPEPRRPTPADQPPKPTRRKFVGAGIVQRSATSFPNAPRYVLLAPTGRILAYLQPRPGINLDLAIGKSMGIYGQRDMDRALQADLIQVTGFSPVRLVP